MKMIAFPLQIAEFQFDGFSREVCRSMVAMVDLDRSGKMGLDEFTELWTSILRWKVRHYQLPTQFPMFSVGNSIFLNLVYVMCGVQGVFKTFDEDASGTLNAFELRKALNSAGYLVNTQVLKALVLRYGDEDGCISFEDFIMCSVKLKAMIGSSLSKARFV